jgi:hypothetical protein
MEFLKELVAVVTRNKVKKIEVIGNPNEKDTKLNKFYKALQEEKVSNDEEAFKLLYEGEGDKNAYYKLKHLLRERLINTLFFIDIKTNKFSNIQETYFQCSKGVMAVEILNMQYAAKIAIPIAEKLLKTTLEYDFTQLSIMLCSKIGVYYAQSEGDRKKFTYYNDLLGDLNELSMKEVLAERRHRDIVSYYVRNKATKKFIGPLAAQYDLEVSELKTRLSSPKLVHMAFMLKIDKHMCENDYKSVIPVCDEALNKLYEFPILNILAILEITFQKIASCTHLKRYEEAKADIEKCLAIQEEGRPNWFKTHELHMTLCLHTRRYEEAWTLYQSTTQHPGFAKIPAHWKETWKIFEVWLYVLRRAGQIKSAGALPGQFRWSKFINELPASTKDKRGMNVTVLIAQIVMAMMDKNPDLVRDQIEALSKYCDRYLNRDNNFRSNCFFRMVVEMEKQGFRKRETIKATKKRLADMSSSPIDITDQSHDVEILPLEDIWGFITFYLPEQGF